EIMERLWSLAALCLLILTAATGCGSDDERRNGSVSCSPSCGSGEVCVLGQCQVDTGQTLVPPEDPVCYTPCRGGPGCSEEGVKAGCIQGLECVDGTCIAPSDKAAKETKKSKKGTCKSDAQCPDFQACIQGRC